MTAIQIPNNWTPRKLQFPVWNYLNRGGNHAELIWHRRFGKDDVSLNWTCLAAHRRVASYWHMLPMANQARRAIWDAVDPHTGIRRIDQAFPKAIRRKTRENDMFIEFLNGSTWQVIGSDNYSSAIGSPPAGIVYSEWALANPAARGYLRPIIRENGGWQIFITTPRGRNHAYTTYNAALQNPGSFAQILTVHDTGIMTPEELAFELAEYQSTFGDDYGRALFEQEWLCSFDAAIMGAFYADQFRAIDQEKRVRKVPHQPDLPVYTCWDIGRTDDTSIWFYQIVGQEIHWIDSVSQHGKEPDYFCSELLGEVVRIDIIDNEVVPRFLGVPQPGAEHRRAYRYEEIQLPHDARAKTFAAQGKSVQEQLTRVFKGLCRVRIVPGLSREDGIQAARQVLRRSFFDESRTSGGVGALREYRREWDDDKKKFGDNPLHDWTSHYADAFRMGAVMVKFANEIEPEQPKPIATMQDLTLNDVWKLSSNPRRRI